ncbi:unnamed protein product [Phaeothamnion confervicola]
MICGDFMEDYEAFVPQQALQSLGYVVDSVSPGKSAADACRTAIHDFEGAQTYSEKRGHNYALNADFKTAKAADYDGLLIPGGRAPEYLALDADVCQLVRDFVAADKPVASVCHGQIILAAAGVLKGKRCTCYPAVGPLVSAAGADYVAPSPIDMAITDGKLITAAAWPGHPEFIKQFVTVLGTDINIGA